jgi:glycosyltransferase involved in cell wall biosynthesis
MTEFRLISVIIPTYNRGHFICEAIDSILNQDVKNYKIEIIVIDDGSTDNTKDILKHYIDNNKIRYIYQKNRGAGAARNNGILNAKGSWITFLDSDDKWLPFHISLQLTVIEHISDCRVIYSDFMISKNNKVRDERGLDVWAKTNSGTETGKWKNIFPDKLDSSTLGLTHKGNSFFIYKGNIFSKFLFQPCMPCWTTMISRECITGNIRFAENLPTWEDAWFACLLAEYNNIFYIDVVTAENRGHSGPRLTQADSMTRTISHITICKEIYMKSSSPYRPTDSVLNNFYMNLNKSLYKEYVKKDELNKANKIGKELYKMGLIPFNLPFLLYYIGSKIPLNPINKLVRLKRFVLKQKES